MADENSGAKANSVNYAANSNKSKQPEPAETPRLNGPVIQGTAVERKEPLRKKFLSAYAGDSAQSVGQYLLTDAVQAFAQLIEPPRPHQQVSHDKQLPLAANEGNGGGHRTGGQFFFGTHNTPPIVCVCEAKRSNERGCRKIASFQNVENSRIHRANRAEC